MILLDDARLASDLTHGRGPYFYPSRGYKSRAVLIAELLGLPQAAYAVDLTDMCIKHGVPLQRGRCGRCLAGC